MKDINIKSCPFCGEIPQSKVFRRSNCIEFIISCRKCEVSMRMCTTDDNFTFDNIHEAIDDKMNECVKMWNTRSDSNVIIRKDDDNETDRC